MAQEQAINTGSGNPAPNPAQYASNAPEFIGGQTNPQTGAIIPASQALADVAPVPPPATPTTQLGTLKAPAPLAPAAGAYLGGTLGGAAGAAVGGGASLSSALSSTASNAKNILEFGGTPASSTTSNAWPQAADLGTGTSDAASVSLGSAADSAVGAGIGTGIVTAGVGALTGEKASVYVPQAVGSTAGSAAGTFIGALLTPVLGPLAAPIGGVIGGTLGGSLKPVQTFVSHAIAPIESFFSHLF